MPALIALAVLMALAIGGLTFIAIRSRLSPAPSLAGRTVVIHTRRPDDQSIRGVMVAQHADRWTLREAVYLGAGGNEHSVGGLTHVPVVNIAWAQEIE